MNGRNGRKAARFFALWFFPLCVGVVHRVRRGLVRRIKDIWVYFGFLSFLPATTDISDCTDGEKRQERETKLWSCVQEEVEFCQKLKFRKKLLSFSLIREDFIQGLVQVCHYLSFWVWELGQTRKNINEGHPFQLPSSLFHKFCLVLMCQSTQNQALSLLYCEKMH